MLLTNQKSLPRATLGIKCPNQVKKCRFLLDNTYVMVYHYIMTSDLTRKKLIEQGYNEFITLCSEESSKGNLKEILDFFLTFEERKVIATRVLLIRELLKGEKTQRQIAAELGISIAKITRGSNMLKLLSDEVKQMLMQKMVGEH
jgi:TrpR family trp operon transcriptional repressor